MDKINRKKIVSLLSDYLQGRIDLEQIDEYAFSVISSDEDVVEEKDSDLIYHILFFLDNVENGIFVFSKPKAKYLVSVLENVDNNLVAIDMVSIIKFQDEFVQSLKTFSKDLDRTGISTRMKTFELSEHTQSTLRSFLRRADESEELIRCVISGDVVQIASILSA